MDELHNCDLVKQKSIELKEFLNKGYLQEVNRQFFHPLGLSMSIDVDKNGEMTLGKIWDNRNDPKGCRFTDKIASSKIFEKRIRNIRKERNRIDDTRGHLLGYSVQPILKNKGE